jgi:hypothetical protein
MDKVPRSQKNRFCKGLEHDPQAGSAGLEFVGLRGIDFKKYPVSEPNVVFSRRNM